MMKETKNVLLVKDDVGKSKPATRDLPIGNFAYGKSEERDPEGVAESKEPNLYENSYEKLEATYIQQGHCSRKRL